MTVAYHDVTPTETCCTNIEMHVLPLLHKNEILRSISTHWTQHTTQIEHLGGLITKWCNVVLLALVQNDTTKSFTGLQLVCLQLVHKPQLRHLRMGCMNQVPCLNSIRHKTNWRSHFGMHQFKLLNRRLRRLHFAQVSNWSITTMYAAEAYGSMPE